MLLRKPLLAVTAATVVAAAALSPKAHVGALIGGGIGAAIGDSTHHRNGAAVGGAIGAIVGAGIASSHNYYGDPYYNSGYYAPPAPSYGYYAPPPRAYYAPAPVYVAPSVVIGYSSSYPRRHYRYSGHRHYYRYY